MLWTVVIILIFNKMVNIEPHIPLGRFHNRNVTLFNEQKRALQGSLRRCMQLNLDHGQFVGMKPQPWNQVWSHYRGSGLRYGEFVVCAYATGQALGIGQAYGNRYIGAPMSAGFDFVYRGIHVEVKTLFGNTISPISDSQWDSAHVFVLYNRDKISRIFRGLLIPPETVCIISNDRMRHLIGI